MPLRKIIPYKMLLFGLLLAVLLAASSCSTITYYTHLINGHIELMSARQPIEKVLANPGTPDDTKDQLHAAQSIRRFAVDTLHLPNNESYSSYADLGRDAVTWNVVATPVYSLKARTWCYWIAGCFSYRGYYQRKRAEALADILQSKGYDVAIWSASAYSTLGWFNDPLLNTMISGSQSQLADVLFHELTHQKIYTNDSSAFNEALATFVGRQGTREWLLAQGDASQLQAYHQSLERQRDFLRLLATTRQKLQTLYEQEASDDDYAVGKAQIFSQLQDNYQQLKRSWNGYTGYDRWFDRPLNNAHLAGLATYYRWVPAFERLYRDAKRWPEFYAKANVLAALKKKQRNAALDALLEE